VPSTAGRTVAEERSGYAELFAFAPPLFINILKNYVISGLIIEFI